MTIPAGHPSGEGRCRAARSGVIRAAVTGIAVAVWLPSSAVGDTVHGGRMEAQHREFIAAHCTRCHDAKEASGGVRLDDIPLDIADIAAAERWQRVLNVLNAGDMPPDDEPQPADAEKEKFLVALSRQMVVARKVHGDSSGIITMRRLNRREYVNTIRDLLDVEVDVRDLPADNDTGRTDTVGAGLFFSSDQFEHYLRIGRIALDEAIVKGEKPTLKSQRRQPELAVNGEKRKQVDDYTAGLKNFERWQKSGRPPQEFGYQDEGDAGVLPSTANLNLPQLRAYLADPATATGVNLAESGFVGHDRTQIPADAPPGRYVLRLRIGVMEPRSAGGHRFIEYGILGDGLPPGEMRILGCHRIDATIEEPQILELPIVIKRAGSRLIGVRERRHNTDAAYWYGRGYNYERTLWLDWVEWEGPIVEQWPPVSHERIFGGIDLAAKPGDAEARELIGRFARRAFRGQPVRPQFLEKLMQHFADRRAAGEPFAEAIKTPLAIVLASPNFLYISERPTSADAAGDARSRQPLGDVDLANRLSYFLWAGPPDERLLSLAADRRLSDRTVLAEEVERMLDDPRIRRFIDGFVYQWLHMVRLDFFQFPFNKFPEFDHSVKQAARNEVYETFRDALANDRPLRVMLESDEVLVNDLLADYYGIRGVNGPEFRRVPVPAGMPRGGLLGMAAVHAMGSDGERTSPVERGAWVLRKLLNDPPPPAPPNVPMLSRFNDKPLPARALMTAHQEQPQCASCHRTIDPIGYGLEHFDAAGRWREEEVVELKERNQVKKRESFPIDSRGALPDGTMFDGFAGLRDGVAKHDRDFAHVFVEHLIEYGLGRPVSFVADEELIAGLLDASEQKKYSPRAIIHALIASEAFRSK